MGQVFVAGIRADSPSGSDTLLLLRVAARFTRGSIDGSYVIRQARAPMIRDTVLASSGRTAIRVLHSLTFSCHGRGTTRRIPWNLHRMPWRGIGFYVIVGGAVAFHEWYHGKHRGNYPRTPWQPRGMSWQLPRNANVNGTQG